MGEQPISNEVALRIALATRAITGVSTGEMIEVLQDHLGDEIDEEGLSKMTVTHLKAAWGKIYEDDEDSGEDATTADIAELKKAVRILWGDIDEANQLPSIEAYKPGDLPNSIRIAVASNRGEELDGHFGSCLRYLIYQLSATDIKLVDIRSALEADLTLSKNDFRVDLIRDCHMLYIAAIGGPAAGKVTQAGIYPMKKEEGGAARELLQELQQQIATAPPPWLAKILGVGVGDRLKNYKLSHC